MSLESFASPLKSKHSYIAQEPVTDRKGVTQTSIERVEYGVHSFRIPQRIKAFLTEFRCSRCNIPPQENQITTRDFIQRTYENLDKYRNHLKKDWW